jgi:hypothetical protein
VGAALRRGGGQSAGAGLAVEGQLEAADQDQVLGMSSEAWPRKRVGVPNDQCKMVRRGLAVRHGHHGPVARGRDTRSPRLVAGN